MIDIVNIKKCSQFTFVTNYQSIGLREITQAIYSLDSGDSCKTPGETLPSQNKISVRITTH